MNKFDKITSEMRRIGSDKDRIWARRLDELSHCDLLDVVIDDTDIEQCLAVLDLVADEKGVSLLEILSIWEMNRAADDAMEVATQEAFDNAG